MATVAALLEDMNAQLQPWMFQDYCPNGLQVQGREQIDTLVTGVSASLALIEAAADVQADAILVHHGYFWKGENPCITGVKHGRIAALLKHQMTLFAYHLPLDAHPEFGNNVQLGQLLKINDAQPMKTASGPSLVWAGVLPSACSGDEFSHQIGSVLGRAPLHIAGSSRPISSVAWCTGAAQDEIETAANAGLDAFVTGEVSERTVLLARELGIHFFAAGHHATERNGVQSLGRYLAQRHDIKHEFIDIENPV